jgi:hypothetical protein
MRLLTLSTISICALCSCGAEPESTSVQDVSSALAASEAHPGSYPLGSTGSSEMRVRSTSERPLPADIGAFRTVCDYSHMSTDDPIVFPGEPGRAHLHTFFGNTRTDAFSTYQSLRSSGNSTCRGGIANRTAYWIPTLMGPGTVPMVPKEAHFYYKSGYEIPGISSRIQRFPNGLRMVAGNGSASQPQTNGNAYWGCTNVYKGHHPQIIDCDVGDFIQLSVVFPQCWNGRDLDSTDHKSHMAYPVDRACPSSHPIALPEISLHVRWARTVGMDVTKLRLSSDHYADGLAGGYSAHADWFEAWDPGVRDAFVTNCVNKSADCHSHLLGDGREMY